MPSEEKNNTRKNKEGKKKDAKKKVHRNLSVTINQEELATDNELKANIVFAKACLFAGFSSLLCLLLNEIGVFQVDPVVMRICCIASAVLLFVPFITIFIVHGGDKWVKYLIVTDSLLVIILLYSVLSYRVAILWSFPLVASVMYFDKKFMNFVTFISIPAITLGHYLAVTLLCSEDDPLRTLEAAMLRGALPRCILFLAIAYAARQITKRTYRMLKNSVDYSHEIARMTSGIQMVMDQTQSLMDTRDIKALASTMAPGVSSLLASMLEMDQNQKLNGVVGLLDANKFCTVDCDGNVVDICRDLGDEIGFEFNNARFKFSKHVNNAVSHIELREGFISLKFYNKGELKGFAVYRYDADTEDYSLKEVLNIFTSSMTSIINNTLLTSDMFRTQEQLAYSLAVVSENSSQETGQHIRRVSEYARVMGRYVCDSDEQLETFRIAAMLHDIGKLMIPKDIIEKPGRLTAEEFGIMKKHVIYGRDIIGNAPGEVMEMARHIILHHHERWDGTGYLGISGEDIDKFARYVSVCDVFDALLSRRSYKAPWPAQKVYEEITSQSGRQFDPGAVEAFKKCYVEMLKIRDQFPDDESDEGNLVASHEASENVSTQNHQSNQDDAAPAVRKQLPKINVDPSIVTPISV